MARYKFSSAFKSKLSEKLMDLGNLSLGALALGQLVSNLPFSWVSFTGGVALFFACYFISYMLYS